jgi:AraC family transcriptional regulator
MGVREDDDVRPRLGLRDPDIDAIMSKLRLELQFGGWSGRLYLESLGAVLAVHLLRNYAGARTARFARSARGGLDAPRLRRIIEFIDAHLGEEISLAELASVADLSPHHLASAFRMSTGIAPHRYLMERRIARGCELLSKSEASVTTIAHALGFASHGHFSESFRRFAGVTPSDFRTNYRHTRIEAAGLNSCPPETGPPSS